MTETTVEALELHVPPVVELLSVALLPTHKVAGLPEIAPGTGLTVATAYERPQLVPSEYVILTVPAATPYRKPVDEPIVAMDVLPLVHVPPVTEFESVAVLPIHVVSVPVMGPTEIGLTVTGVVTIQWVASSE
jgi:hypothetical protein